MQTGVQQPVWPQAQQMGVQQPVWPQTQQMGVPQVGFQNQMGMQPGGYAPQATAAVDTTGDGRANAVVTGVDRNRDGIPDELQGGGMQGGGMVGGMGHRGGGYAPQATAAVDTTGDGRANYVITGEDRNRDGIPDALQAAAQVHNRPAAAAFHGAAHGARTTGFPQLSLEVNTVVYV